MSVRKFMPSESQLFETIKTQLEEIKPGERVQIYIPKEYSHPLLYSHDHRFINWDAVEEVQMDIRGSILKPNVIASLRFEDDESRPVIVDIYHV